MKISIDTRGINLYKGTGIGTYTENLLKELLNLDNINNYSLFWSGADSEYYKKQNTSIVLSPKKHGGFFEGSYIPSYTKRNSIDLHHIPQNGIGLTTNYTVPTVVTIHDLIPYTMPETVGDGYLERFLSSMPQIVDVATGIITVSEFSKDDILRFFPKFPKDKIKVTPLAANSNFKPIEKQVCKKFMKDNFNLDNKYILYIGGFSCRKNVRELIIAFNDIKDSLVDKITLVLVGSIRDEGKKLKELVTEMKLQDYVLFTDYLSEDYLPLIYSGAEIFIYPSLYEGFGLPPLEAMSCKTPVITSNLTSIPEVTGNCALLINPFNTTELSESIYKLLSDYQLKSHLAEEGYKRSLQFNWRLTAEKTLSFYNELLK